MLRQLILLAGSWVVVILECGAPPACTVYRDIPYYAGPDDEPEQQVLDLYLPPGGRDFPTLVFIHGGSWHTGDKDSVFYPYHLLGNRLAKRGVAVAVVDYRLSPAVRHPEHVRDAARAFAWTYDHIAAYGGDADEVYLFGHSAGAHLVALLALDPRYLAEVGHTPADVAGVVALSGPYDIAYLWDVAPLLAKKLILEPAFGKDPGVRAAASPVRYARAGAPPFLVAYAQYDHTGFGDESKRLAEALTRAGAPTPTYELPGRTHFTEMTEIGRAGDVATALIMDFVTGDGHARTAEP